MISLIKIENINKSYRKTKILKGVTLSFQEKGFVTILGKSGSGKTTLLNIIGGLDKAKGTITYDDVKINNYDSKIIDLYRSKNIGYVFQNYLLLNDLSVFENIDISLALTGINNKEERKKRIDQCLKAVNMKRYKRRNCAALSGGQQQRVAIARALAKNSKVLICDEPTGNLDSSNARGVMEILKAISYHKLVILVTHNENLAYQYSDRIIRISDGIIKQDDDNDINEQLLDKNEHIIDINQLEKKTYVQDNIKINTIFDSQNQNIELTLISYQGKIKIIPKDNLQLIDESYHFIDKKKEDKNNEINLVFDDNFDNKVEKKHFLKKVLKSFNRVFNVKKRTKLLYSGFMIFGVLISSILYGLNITQVEYQKNNDEFNSSKRSYNSEIVLLEDTNAPSSTNQFTINNLIDILDDENSGIIGFTPTILSKQFMDCFHNNFPNGIDKNISYDASLTLVNYDMFKDEIKKLLHGNLMSQYNDVMVSEGFADYYLANFRLYNKFISTEDIIGCYFDFGVGFPKFNVVGVFEDSGLKIYANQNNYLDLLNFNHFYESNIEFGNYLSQAKFMTKEEYIAEYKDINYLDEFNEDSFSLTWPNVYISKSLYNQIQKSLIYNQLSLCLISRFDSDDKIIIFDSENDKNTFMNNYRNDLSFYDRYYFKSYIRFKDIQQIDKSNVTYINDNYIPSAGDIIVPKSVYEENMTIQWANIVGYYTNEDYNFSVYINPETYKMLINNSTNRFNVYYDKLVSEDLDKTNQFFQKYGLQALNKNQYLLSSNNFNDVLRTIIITIIVILIITSLFMYLMNRSKMIKNIYTIGVFRSLGVEKRKIYHLQFIDSLIVTSFTIVLGYICTYLFILYLSIAFNAPPINLFIFFSGIILIYLVNVISSLIPLFNLLRKTPREIIIKYDI